MNKGNFRLLAAVSVLCFTILGTSCDNGDEKVAWFFAAIWALLAFITNKEN